MATIAPAAERRVSVKAEDVRHALRARFGDRRRYAIAEEVGLTTGYSHRRLDMVVIDCYGSNGFRLDGIEIKVSTQDLRRELADPEKHIAFFDVIDYYTLAAPASVCEPLMDIIPKKWGILIINEDGTTRYKRKPLALEDRKADRAVPRGFFASITRAIQGQQPSALEVNKAYERGLNEGKENAERRHGYLVDRVAREAARLEEYDKMVFRFHLYGVPVDEIMDEFEVFRKLETDRVKRSIKNTVVMLEKVYGLLSGEEITNAED